MLVAAMVVGAVVAGSSFSNQAAWGSEKHVYSPENSLPEVS